jgi:hypothetical protein
MALSPARPASGEFGTHSPATGISGPRRTPPGGGLGSYGSPDITATMALWNWLSDPRAILAALDAVSTTGPDSSALTDRRHAAMRGSVSARMFWADAPIQPEPLPSLSSRAPPLPPTIPTWSGVACCRGTSQVSFLGQPTGSTDHQIPIHPVPSTRQCRRIRRQRTYRRSASSERCHLHLAGAAMSSRSFARLACWVYLAVAMMSLNRTAFSEPPVVRTIHLRQSSEAGRSRSDALSGESFDLGCRRTYCAGRVVLALEHETFRRAAFDVSQT